MHGWIVSIASTLFVGAIVIATITLVVWALVKFECAQKMGVAFVMMALLLGVYVMANGEEVGVVTIVFYQDDSCIVDFDSENDLFSDRGDLMPGDVVSWDGESLTLISQSDEPWFEIVDDGDPVAAFLYPEDAAWVREAIER